jgi:peroxiredoxin
MYQDFDREDVEIVIIDVRNMRERTLELAEEYELTVPVLLDDKDISHEVYGTVFTPTTFILDRKGRAVFRHVGFAEGQEEMLEKEIHLLLERS